MSYSSLRRAWVCIAMTVVSLVAIAGTGCNGKGGLGASCTGNSDCKSDHSCVESLCLKPCTSTRDCSERPEYTCGKVKYTSTRMGITTDQQIVNKCVPPSMLAQSISSAVANANSAMASARAETDAKQKIMMDDMSITMKKASVKSVLNLSAIEHQRDPMPEATFDAAWDAVSRDDKLALSAEDLGKRIGDAAAKKKK